VRLHLSGLQQIPLRRCAVQRVLGSSYFGVPMRDLRTMCSDIDGRYWVRARSPACAAVTADNTGRKAKISSKLSSTVFKNASQISVLAVFAVLGGSSSPGRLGGRLW
jgi:hypothetical protein